MLRAVFVALIACVLASCTGSPSGMVSTGERYQVAQAPTEGAETYRLDVGDKLRMTVFNEQSLSGEFAVSANGVLSLPLIGDIPARGRTSQEVALAVQQKLGDGYLRDPKVSMDVISYRPFFILGEVKAPGQYPYVNGLTVFNAVATAQGFTPRAEKNVVFIRREGAVEEQPFQVTPSLRVLPGDTIRFGERYF